MVPWYFWGRGIREGDVLFLSEFTAYGEAADFDTFQTIEEAFEYRDSLPPWDRTRYVVDDLPKAYDTQADEWVTHDEMDEDTVAAIEAVQMAEQSTTRTKSNIGLLSFGPADHMVGRQRVLRDCMTGESLCRRSDHRTEVSSTSSTWDIPDVALDTPLRLSGLRGTAQMHDDQNPSLSVSQGADERTLLCCDGGRSTAFILDGLGLSYGYLYHGYPKRLHWIPSLATASETGLHHR